MSENGSEYPVYAKLSEQKALQLGGDYFYSEDDEDTFDVEDVLLTDEYFDCGFVPGEGCLMVGTEECDFDCPYRDELMKCPAYPNVDFLASDF